MPRMRGTEVGFLRRERQRRPPQPKGISYHIIEGCIYISFDTYVKVALEFHPPLVALLYCRLVLFCCRRFFLQPLSLPAHLLLLRLVFFYEIFYLIMVLRALALAAFATR